MDGYEFMKQYSKTPYYGIIPVIVTTESGREHEEEALKQFDEFEIFDYIPKPLNQISKGLLYNKINTAIKYRKVMREFVLLKTKPDAG